MIYFAGHGLEVDGSNNVVPVNAVLERDVDVDSEAESLNRILFAAEPASKLQLIILDACRDNPFARRMKRTLSRGLVGVEAPGLDIRKAFGYVRDDVMSAIGGP